MMKKVCKQLLVFLLVFAVIFTSGGMTGLSVVHADEGMGPGSVTDAEGIKTTEDTKTETRDNDQGGTTSTTTTTKEWSGTNDEGAQVEGSETKKDTVVTDDEGDTVGTSGSSEGKETTTKTDSKTETSEKSEEGNKTVEESDPTLDPEKTIEGEIKGSSKDDPEKDPENINVEGDVKDKTVTVTPESEETRTGSVDVEALQSEIERVLGIDALVIPEEGTSTSEDGKTTTTVEVNKDDSQKVTGYTSTETTKTDDGTITVVTHVVITGSGYTTTKTTTTVTEGDKELVSKGDPVTKSETSEQGETKTDVKETEEIVLPTKPVAGKITAADGTITETVVNELLDEKGRVIGYQTTKTVTDPDGRETSSSSESIWGTRVIKTTTKTTPTTVTTVTESEVTRRSTETITVETRTEKIESEVEKGSITVQMGDIEGSIDIEHNSNLNVTQQGPAQVGTTDTSTDLYSRENNEGSNSPSFDPDSSSKYQWLGEYGIESAFRITKDGYQAHQFILRDEEGNPYYVYCADFAVSPKSDAEYNMTLVENADYYSSSEANIIRAIVMNGYWGTDDGDALQGNTGSLKRFKSFLYSLTDKEGKPLFNNGDLDSMTPGMALAATQAAIWHYANSGDEDDAHVTGSDVVYDWYYNSGIWNNVDENEKALVNRMYGALIGITGQEATSKNTTITREDFAQKIALTVLEKKQSGQYKATISVAMGMNLSDLETLPESEIEAGNDLKLCLVDQNGKVKEEIVLKNANPTLGEDGKYIYSFGVNPENELLLNNGDQLTVRLVGTQYLSEGVYLFSGGIKKDQDEYIPSQTFIGIGESSQAINLSTLLTFNVTDPVVKKTESGSTEKTEQENIKTYSSTETTTAEVINTKTEVTTETTDKTSREWSDSYATGIELNSGYYNEDDNDEESEEYEESENESGGSVEEESEKTIKKASVGVQTGDETPIFFWGILLIAAFGMIMLIMRRRVKNN